MLRLSHSRSVFGSIIPSQILDAVSLPLKHGEMDIRIPSHIADSEYMKSKLAVSYLNTSGTLFDIEIEQENIIRILRQEKDLENVLKKDDLMERSDDHIRRALDHASMKGSSNWLSISLIDDRQIRLSKTQFQNALAARYTLKRNDDRNKCSCRGIIYARHDAIRDTLIRLLKTTCSDVRK
ncbi:hypothetical protein GJ496_005553 [Pomphorhynchus laevis]|nr:hypothetical protein GJ496_005553 [Pomphorhynchus laevis]